MYRRKHSHETGERGAALLMTLLMLSLLVVLVGQFSYTVVLDRKVAVNYLRDAQVSLDILAGVEAAAAQITRESSRGPQENPPAAGSMVIDSEESQVSLELEEEDAKFNVNILLEPPEGVSPDEAQQALARLLKSIDEPEGTLPSGLAEGIAQYLHDKGSPALTLRELSNVEGLTEEMLYSQPDPELGEGFAGLSHYLTVFSDGLINYHTADEKVLLSLAPWLNPNMLEMLVAALENPPENLPPNIQAMLDNISRFLKPGSSTYSALVRSQSGNYAKKCMAVLRRTEDGVSVILWDELEP